MSKTMLTLEDLHSVFNHLPSNHAILDTNQNVIEVTNAFLKTTNRTREELIGKNLFVAFPEQVEGEQDPNAPKILETIKRCFETKQPQTLLNVKYDLFNTKTNAFERRYWNVHEYPVMNGGADVHYVIHSPEDITEQASLRLSLDYAKIFQLLVENVKDYAIFMLDTKGNIRTWNEGARRLKQYTADEIIGKNFTIFYTPEDLVKKKPEKELIDAQKYGRTEDEYWRVRKDGSKFWADVVITAIYDDSNNLIGFGKVTRDLTDRKLAEERVIAAYEESARLKSEFLANMSHEIRTPMNGIASAAALLTDTTLSTDQKELVGLISDSSSVLVKILNDILDYFKMESNQLRLVSEVFDVKEVINRLVQNFELTKTKPIALTVVADDIPKVKGDPFQFKQIVINLIDNALKFTEKGTIKVLATWNDPSKTLHVQVCDTGIGIAKEDVAKLFSPFMQLDPSSKKKYKGTGLGLSICKRLVELMGGQIGVESELGVGSTFWFTVPLEVVNEPLTQTSPVKSHSEEALHPDARILIAEDNTVNQTVALKILKKLGYKHMTIASDGIQAVDMCKSGNFDVVLMDIQMPNMDGLEATGKIREFNKSIPIIAMTANALTGDAERAISAGMNDYLSKPINFALMATTLNRYIGR